MLAIKIMMSKSRLFAIGNQKYLKIKKEENHPIKRVLRICKMTLGKLNDCIKNRKELGLDQFTIQKPSEVFILKQKLEDIVKG